MDTVAEVCRGITQNPREPFGIWLAIHTSLKLRLKAEESRWARRLEVLHEQDPSTGPQGRAGRPWGVNERLILAQTKCNRWGPTPDNVIAENLNRTEAEMTAYWNADRELEASRNVYDRWYTRAISLLQRSEAIMDRYMQALIRSAVLTDEQLGGLHVDILQRKRDGHLTQYGEGIRRQEENGDEAADLADPAAAGIDFAGLY